MLDDIKRKAMENDSMRRDNGDLSTHMAMMQVAQSDMLQQLAQLQENFSEVVRELAETKRKQGLQQQQMKSMMNVIQQHSGSQSKQKIICCGIMLSRRLFRHTYL